ncbi:hypothetical protein ABKV19_002431 [Rosa sericea]
MQKSLHIIWLPLFLGVLFNVVCIFHSYSVMASDMRHRRGKRLLQQNDSEGLNRDAEIETRNNSENFYTIRARTDSGGFGTEGMHQRRSRRPRRVPEPPITEKNYTSEHLNRRVKPAGKNNTLLLNQTSVNTEDSHVSHTGHCSFSFGQASYQKSREGYFCQILVCVSIKYVYTFAYQM